MYFLVKQFTDDSSSTEEHLKRRIPRVSRMIPSSDLNTERDIDPDQTTITTTTTGSTVQQKPGPSPSPQVKYELQGINF